MRYTENNWKRSVDFRRSLKIQGDHCHEKIIYVYAGHFQRSGVRRL